VFSRRDRMTAHLRSADGHNINVAIVGSGRRTHSSRWGSDTRELSSPDRQHSRSPSYRLDVNRCDHSPVRHRRSRNSVTSSPTKLPSYRQDVRRRIRSPDRRR